MTELGRISSCSLRRYLVITISMYLFHLCVYICNNWRPIICERNKLLFSKSNVVIVDFFIMPHVVLCAHLVYPIYYHIISCMMWFCSDICIAVFCHINWFLRSHICRYVCMMSCFLAILYETMCLWYRVHRSIFDDTVYVAIFLCDRVRRLFLCNRLLRHLFMIPYTSSSFLDTVYATICLWHRLGCLVSMLPCMWPYLYKTVYASLVVCNRVCRDMFITPCKPSCLYDIVCAAICNIMRALLQSMSIYIVCTCPTSNFCNEI